MQALLSHKRRTKKDISVQNEASVAMLSNHKMRAVCSSLGHVSLYDGLLPVITSDFDKKIKEGEWMLTALTPLGTFSPSSVFGVPRGFRCRYEFEKTETEVRYAAHFSGKGRSFSLFVRLFLAPASSLFIAECEASGDVTVADFSLSFSPRLMKTPRGAFCFFDCRDEKERFFFRERRVRNGVGEPLYFGVCAHGASAIPIRFGAARERACVRREGAKKASFAIGLAHDIDDLKALLLLENGDLFAFSRWQGVLAGRDAVSEYRGCMVTEEMLLLRFMMGKKRHCHDGGFLGGLPMEGPLVLCEVYTVDEKTLGVLREWISLYIYMTIRGASFTLLILCWRAEAREKLSLALRDMGCETLSFYAGGIFVKEASSFQERKLSAIRARADVRVDLERGAWLP